MPRIYLDTSVYLCILLGDVKASQIMKLTTRKELCSSTVLFLECERNLVRLSREKVITEDDCSLALDRLQQDLELFVTRDLTIDLALKGEFPPVRIPRSFDLAHLRTAKWFQQNGGIEQFLTLDRAQRLCAVDMGLAAPEI